MKPLSFAIVFLLLSIKIVFAIPSVESILIAATGRFEQDANTVLNSSFYDEQSGLQFNNMSEKYKRGDFMSYVLINDTIGASEAEVLKEGNYSSIHCLLSQTYCSSSVENITHQIRESIIVDYNGIHWYEAGLGKTDPEKLVLKIDAKMVTYFIETGEIPISTRIINSSGNDIDFEWRGKMTFLGEDYYVKDIRGIDEIYLEKGNILDNVSSDGYTAEYMDYEIKINNLTYNGSILGSIHLDVKKPDGTVVQIQTSRQANGIVDALEFAGIAAWEENQTKYAKLLVYDTTTSVLIEDGKDIKINGENKPYWRVSFGTRSDLSAGKNDVTEYDGATGTVLENITISYRHDIELKEGESLNFPLTFKLTFYGYKSNVFQDVPVSGECEGNIKIQKNGTYQLLLSFTDDEGKRWDNIRMHQGPFKKGDRFVLSGKVYEYDSAEEQPDNTTMKVTFKNLIDGGKESFNLSTVDSPTLFYLHIKAFEEAAGNDNNIKIEPDAVARDSNVFIGTALSTGVPVLCNREDLYFVWSSNTSLLNGSTVGVWSTQVGILNDFEINENNLTISIVNEDDTTDQNDAGLVASAVDRDDTLIRIVNQNGEYIVVDLYDRDYNDTTDLYYDESVAASMSDLPWNSTQIPPARLNRDVDTTLILPNGGDKILVNYGAGYRIDGIEILHPQKSVDATVFIGTSERINQEIVMTTGWNIISLPLST